ncbi:hypothetical protein CYR55_14060 [Chimaeribacter californicus]|uniref:Uncharacterized protein n=1 Tax=Chimaeribacter californicus TaxID=2060067 RepID=A0A2N5E2U4_9GAMM|nr:hypothetical protein [Chimaeribacter californicus]PLR35025.1 hypothetical protein CYR55_14060 [Chimaeribacter californicus]
MTTHTLASLPVAITLSAWDCAVEPFGISQWETRQRALINAAQEAWNSRSARRVQQVAFSLTELTERTQQFIARYSDNALVVTLGE